jgi:hypothetical protein
VVSTCMLGDGGREAVGDPASLWEEEEGVVVSTCMQRPSGSSARMRSTHRVLDEGGNQGSSELIQHAPRP